MTLEGKEGIRESLVSEYLKMENRDYNIAVSVTKREENRET